MNIDEKLKELNFHILLKTGIGSAIAIILADRFNLLYSASAGIITLLTIQNTKKETIDIAFKRILAFFIAVTIAYFMFSGFGYTSIVFGGFIFIFVAISNLLGFQEGISMNAVLITHFLIEKRMDFSFITNEIFILLIGMSIGILFNLIMPSNTKKINSEQKRVEVKIKDILRCMGNVLEGNSECLKENERPKEIDFNELDDVLDRLVSKAYEEAGNTLLTETKYQISYLEMRKLQVVVLRDIFKSIKEIHDVLPEAVKISKYMKKTADEFHESNNVKGLLLELEALYNFFRKEDLPITRDEFENRAILFNILKDLENFLEIKSSFIERSIHM